MRYAGQVPGPILAFASGLLSSLAFAPFGMVPLVLVAPVPLLWALGVERRPSGRRSFLLGWIAAFVHFAIVLHWILFLPSEEMTIPGLMIPSVLFMAAYLACFFGFAAALGVWVSRRLSIPLGVCWALSATLADLGRSLGPLAFPWGAPAYALKGVTATFQFTSLTGFWGLALWVALCGGLLFQALAWDGKKRLAAGIVWFLVLAAPWVHGSVVLSRAPTDRIDAGEGLRLVLIQPNTSREIKWDPRYREIVVEDLLERTRLAADLEPELIVWPETAAPILILQDPIYRVRLEETVREIGIPVLVGTLDHRQVNGAYESHNSAALFDSAGRLTARYDKQRLVPFSERMPFQHSIPWLSSLNFGQSDFTPGRGNLLFSVGEGKIGCLICFESIFPEMARRFCRDGANLLLNITNDFWFGDTSAPIQHADMAIFRAVETRTPLVRCANTGISLVVDPWGRVIQETETFVEAMVATSVVPSSGTTFYVRHGEWLVRILAAGLAAMVLASLLPLHRTRG